MSVFTVINVSFCHTKFFLIFELVIISQMVAIGIVSGGWVDLL